MIREYYQAVIKFSGETCGHHHRTKQAAEKCCQQQKHCRGTWKPYLVIEGEGYPKTYHAFQEVLT